MFFFPLKAACQAGEFSPTGLANCEACPVNSYQSLLRQTSCIQCPGSSVTLGDGTKSISGCGSKFFFRKVLEKKINKPIPTKPRERWERDGLYSTLLFKNCKTGSTKLKVNFLVRVRFFLYCRCKFQVSLPLALVLPMNLVKKLRPLVFLNHHLPLLCTIRYQEKDSSLTPLTHRYIPSIQIPGS